MFKLNYTMNVTKYGKPPEHLFHKITIYNLCFLVNN